MNIFEANLHYASLLFDEPPDVEEAASVLEWVSCGNPFQIYATGVGKSGLAARKFAASLAAHGVPAQFIDPLEALHGGKGRITKFDRVVAFSASGNTVELVSLAAALGRSFDVGIYGSQLCGLRDHTDNVIVTGVDLHGDVCTNFVPSMSFIAQVLAADALALRVAELNGAPGLAATHPGGQLGLTRPWC